MKLSIKYETALTTGTLEEILISATDLVDRL